MLSSEFSMKDLCPLSYFIGIAGHSSGLFLSQSKYAYEILNCVGMSSCKFCPTPKDTKSNLTANLTHVYADISLYHSHPGALHYLTFTILDISM